MIRSRHLLLAVPGIVPMRSALAQALPKVMRVVLQAEWAVTDPLVTTAWISTIHGTVVWD